ncbi:hypothetical protein O7635_07215 [Asanoa sp. WMMD1127]|uniref:hypothetical protein n=1 Tax=Asanoa sp. WMMD1127 TaxID=3016107 RepID=UPI002416FBB9|nr:hypothetical protein [Asanoa sp. WMMD1127]MDG4821642.1 hypothetical protein [Asanoa sp. WMMD1127]
MKLPAALLAVVMVAVGSGCARPGSIPDAYALGVARIGERYHVLAPLCAGEAVAAVQVVDDGRTVDGSGAAESTQDTWWQVENPVAEGVEGGSIPLGDDAAFR